MRLPLRMSASACGLAGSQQISYARLLQLLGERRVKRITMLADGKVAIVEVPLFLSCRPVVLSTLPEVCPDTCTLMCQSCQVPCANSPFGYAAMCQRSN